MEFVEVKFDSSTRHKVYFALPTVPALSETEPAISSFAAFPEEIEAIRKDSTFTIHIPLVQCILVAADDVVRHNLARFKVFLTH